MNTKLLDLLADEFNTDTRHSIPKYLRVSEAILQLLEKRQLSSGQRIPTETELTTALPVSLGTIQKALNNLTDSGILKRIQGSGTYVAESPTQLSDLWHFRFINSDEKKILPVSTKVLSLDRIKQSGPWDRFLGKDNFFIRITREVEVNQEFSCISQFYLRDSDFAPLMNLQFSEFEGAHIRNIIKQHFGKSTQRVVERVSADTFPDTVCRWLNMPLQSMGLICQVLGYTYKDRPLSFQQLFVPPNARPLEIRERQPI